MEYYLEVKRNEVLIHGTTWMNLENTLSERSHSQRPQIIRFHSHESLEQGDL